MNKRGVSEEEVREVLEHGELLFTEIDKRFGVKKYSGLWLGKERLVVVWYHNKKDEKEVITIYWRGERK